MNFVKKYLTGFWHIDYYTNTGPGVYSGYQIEWYDESATGRGVVARFMWARIGHPMRGVEAPFRSNLYPEDDSIGVPRGAP